MIPHCYSLLQVPHLKVALLDYLKKKKAPSHLDAMFKLNFTMHREIAEMLFESATERIADVTASEGTVIMHGGHDPNCYSLELELLSIQRALVSTPIYILFSNSPESKWPDSADLRQISATIETVIMDLADAAESFVKADCLLHALECTKQAELLSLQVYYIQRGSMTKIIKLNQETFTNWINNHPVS